MNVSGKKLMACHLILKNTDISAVEELNLFQYSLYLKSAASLTHLMSTTKVTPGHHTTSIRVIFENKVERYYNQARLELGPL